MNVAGLIGVATYETKGMMNVTDRSLSPKTVVGGNSYRICLRKQYSVACLRIFSRTASDGTCDVELFLESTKTPRAMTTTRNNATPSFSLFYDNDYIYISMANNCAGSIHVIGATQPQVLNVFGIVSIDTSILNSIPIS